MILILRYYQVEEMSCNTILLDALWCVTHKDCDIV